MLRGLQNAGAVRTSFSSLQYLTLASPICLFVWSLNLRREPWMRCDSSNATPGILRRWNTYQYVYNTSLFPVPRKWKTNKTQAQSIRALHQMYTHTRPRVSVSAYQLTRKILRPWRTGWESSGNSTISFSMFMAVIKFPRLLRWLNLTQRSNPGGFSLVNSPRGQWQRSSPSGAPRLAATEGEAETKERAIFSLGGRESSSISSLRMKQLNWTEPQD